MLGAEITIRFFSTTFLTTMAALSTAVQTFIDHAIKGRSTWLDKATPDDPTHEARRQSTVHLLSFLAGADSAGIVLGAKVPIILTSRADTVEARLASCAVAVFVAQARRQSAAKAIL